MYIQKELKNKSMRFIALSLYKYIVCASSSNIFKLNMWFEENLIKTI